MTATYLITVHVIWNVITYVASLRQGLDELQGCHWSFQWFLIICGLPEHGNRLDLVMHNNVGMSGQSS